MQQQALFSLKNKNKAFENIVHYNLNGTLRLTADNLKVLLFSLKKKMLDISHSLSP